MLPLGPAPEVLARTLAGASVGAGTLTAHRKVPAVTETAVATEIHQALDALLHFAARVAFDLDRSFDGVADRLDVGFRELVARIRAVTRRSAPRADERIQLAAGPLTVDLRTRRVRLEGRELELTPKEFDLLTLLVSDPGAVVSRQRILEEVWDTHWYGPTKTIDVHVASLRRKLGDPRWVETVRGVGFRLGLPGA